MDSAINFVEANMYKDFHLVWVNILLTIKSLFMANTFILLTIFKGTTVLRFMFKIDKN